MALFVLAAFNPISAATAQTTARVALQTDYRFRGYSLSSEQPVVIADLGQELGGGFYANGSALFVFDDGPALLGGQLNIGYARRLTPAVSIDAGVVRSQYASRVSGRAMHYTEFYAGVAAHNLSARVSLSPDYFRDGVSTIYGEIDGVLPVDPDLRLTAHAGALHYIEGGLPDSDSTRFDWRLGIARRLGNFDAYLNVSGRARGPDYSATGRRDRWGVVAGISYSF